MHYAVPRILSGAGRLERFFTDIDARRGWPSLLRLMPPPLRRGAISRVLARTPAEVPAERVTAFNRFGFDYARRLRNSRSTNENTRIFLWGAREFNRLVLAAGLDCRGIYTFNTAGLELLQHVRRAGGLTVMEQTILPRSVELQIVADEQARFPDWEPPIAVDGSMAEYIAREREEWQYADRILCGSPFVASAIGECGGPQERCVVVPYGVAIHAAHEARRRSSGPLRVLTVGTVGLRKGSPYVQQAARRLCGKAVVRMAGAVKLQAAAARQLAEDVELLGSVPRAEVARHFQWADVFLLPSLCEGSATVTYEALAWGLPVVTTPNAGSLVRDGLDGFVVPPRDVDALVERIERLADDEPLRMQMANNALARAHEGSYEAYAVRLLAAI
jgi:glycosyltransferase involved in cell wall biosynthesis